MNLKVRPKTDNDTQFILNTWLDHIGSTRYFKRCPRRIIRDNCLCLIRALSANCTTLIACSDEDEDQIFAYLVYSGTDIHFLYTKLIYRNMGISKELLKQANVKFCQYTTGTDNREFTTYARKNGIVFNPWGKFESKELEIGGIDQSEAVGRG